MYKNYHPVSSIPLEEHHVSFSTLSPLFDHSDDPLLMMYFLRLRTTWVPYRSSLWFLGCWSQMHFPTFHSTSKVLPSLSLETDGFRKIKYQIDKQWRKMHNKNINNKTRESLKWCDRRSLKLSPTRCGRVQRTLIISLILVQPQRVIILTRFSYAEKSLTAIQKVTAVRK